MCASASARAPAEVTGKCVGDRFFRACMYCYFSMLFFTVVFQSLTCFARFVFVLIFLFVSCTAVDVLVCTCAVFTTLHSVQAHSLFLLLCRSNK